MTRQEILKALNENSATENVYDSVYVRTEGVSFYVGDIYEMTDTQLAEALAYNGFII